LKKLGIESVSRSTVVNILKEHGLEPGPRRGDDTWDGFIQRHAKTLWACDFLSVPVLTFRGWRDAYVLLFINVLTRKCWVTPSTLHPTRSWTKEQGIAFVEQHPRRDDPNAPSILLRDRDGKYGPRFDGTLRKRGVTPIALQHCSPNMNAYAERMVQTIQQECLDHFVVCGRRHLDHLVCEYLVHYHEERPHQGVGNVPLNVSPAAPARATPRGQPAPASPMRLDRIECDERLGGLLRHYRWRAAA